MSDKQDRAIQASAKDEPEFKRPSSPQRLTGKAKLEVLKTIDRAGVKINPSYSHVNVIDYPSFHGELYDHYLVNFYFEHEEDPRTTIHSLRVYTDGTVGPA